MGIKYVGRRFGSGPDDGGVDEHFPMMVIYFKMVRTRLKEASD
jgi:hypothetical protein